MILADLGATHQTDMDVLRRACVEELPESGVARLVYDVAQAHLSPIFSPIPHIAHISPTYLPQPTTRPHTHRPPTRTGPRTLSAVVGLLSLRRGVARG